MDPVLERHELLGLIRSVLNCVHAADGRLRPKPGLLLQERQSFALHLIWDLSHLIFVLNDVGLRRKSVETILATIELAEDQGIFKVDELKDLLMWCHAQRKNSEETKPAVHSSQ